MTASAFLRTGLQLGDMANDVMRVADRDTKIILAVIHDVVC